MTSKKATLASHFEPLETRKMMSTSAAPATPPAGSVKLTGALIGTAGSYQSKGNTIANATDGNLSTYFDAPAGVQGWVGLDLGSLGTITQLQFVPRSGFASRMVGGIFQASTTSDFSANVTTLYTVTASPAGGVYTQVAIKNTVSDEYVRYLAPVSGSGNIAELEFDGILAPVVPVTPVTPVIPVTPVVPVVPVIPVAPATPLAPVNVVATANSATDISLAWQEDPSSTVTSFIIERQGPTDATYVTIGTTTGGTATAFDDNTVAAATAYSYEIIANNLTSPSLGSAPAIATTPAAAVIPITPITPVVPIISVVPVTPVTPVVPPATWSDSDIGAVGLAGSATVNTNGTITVSGSGADIWNTADAFNFESQSFTGNGTVITQVTAQTNPSTWSKSGIMMRESLNDDSRYVLLALTPSYGVTMQARTATHVTPTFSLAATGKTGVWLEMVRTGSSFSGYVSTNGTTWTLVGTVVIPMVNNIQAGLAVTAHNNTKICTATFSNVSLNPAGTEAAAWSDGATAPIARWESENFSYNGIMYVFGGYIDRTLDATTECDAYNPATNTWSTVTTMPGAITHAAVTMVGDTAYIAGGNVGTFSSPSSGAATNAVITYDTTTGVWGTATSLPAAVTSGGLVCINNHLIYYGGINATNTTDLGNTWSLDLGNPKAAWVAEASMPDPRNHIGYAEINGIAYAIGGQHLYKQTTGNVADVDAYNPVTNTWTAVTSLPFAWSGIHSTTLVVNNKLVILGGQTNGGYDGIYLNNIEEYDPNANVWSAVGILPEANQGQAVAYINNTLIVADGTVDNEGGWAQNQTWLDSEIVL